MAGARLHFSDFVYELRALLRERQPPSPLYIVGGAVRDAWLGKPTDDIDIAVDGDSIQMARRVADSLGADLFVMDRERGVARVIVRQNERTLTVDFAKLRGYSLEADLRFRDFTMNAMAVDLLGDMTALIDPLGGEADLSARILRQCSLGSFADDPIRSLRAVRQSVQFGARIHPDTLEQLRRTADFLRLTSPERIRDEFFKLLALDGPAGGLRVLARLGMLEQILPGIDAAEADALHHQLRVVERLSAIVSIISADRGDNGAAAFDLGMLSIQLGPYRARLQERLAREYGIGRRHAELLLLASLLQDKSSRDAMDGANRLRLSREEGRRLASAVRGWRRITRAIEWDDLMRHRYWHQLGAEGLDALLLGLASALAARGAELRQQEWLAHVENAAMLLDAWFNRYDELVMPPQLISGAEIMALLGIREGRVVGRLLDALREAQVTKTVVSIAEARDFIKRQYATLA